MVRRGDINGTMHRILSDFPQCALLTYHLLTRRQCNSAPYHAHPHPVPVVWPLHRRPRNMRVPRLRSVALADKPKALSWPGGPGGARAPWVMTLEDFLSDDEIEVRST